MTTSSQQSENLLRAADSFALAVRIGRRFSFRMQRSTLVIAGSVFVLASVVWLLLRLTDVYLAPPWVDLTVSLTASVSLLVLMIVGAIHSYYLYYRLAESDAKDSSAPDTDRLSYPAAELLLAMSTASNPTAGFLSSRFGQLVCIRSGADPAGLRADTDDSDSPSLSELLAELSTPSVSLTDLVMALHNLDNSLQEALLTRGIQPEELRRAAQWVAHRDTRFRQAIQPYSMENLRQIMPLGRDFAYGRAYTLKRFSRALSFQSVFLGAGDTSVAFAQDIEATFNTLSRPRNANVLLVGSASGGIGDILAVVRRRLQTEEVPQNLVDHKLHVLNTQALLATTDQRGGLEQLLNRLLVEATNAGNVLLVIENIADFQTAAADRGVNLFGILETFLDHPDLPIIATSSTGVYHERLEGREVMTHFGTVLVHDIADEELFILLSEVVDGREGDRLVTVDGINAVIQGARRLISDDEMPHAAVDLLLEILAAHPGQRIDQAQVETYLTQKTGIPTGAVTDQERGTLSGLADKLHERIVGQDEAVQAITAALRRNRAGVEDADKPIGTFLFLGPTGVGKTETAKTLAASYFESANFSRLDMTEYSQPGAINDLRGATGESGRLANIVREHPYGVLLLDEFEKAHTAVHDLFLQIIDEGHFTDGAGHRISLDNLIIIATSNAGAQRIFSLVEEGVELTERKDELVDELVSDGSFRPELMNRFDDIILFHPLSATDLHAVTDLLLEELKGRLRERGYRLELEPSVTDHIVELGYSPEFGARAIQRVIQDTVETAVADTIIDQGLSEGDTIKLDASDLSVSS